MTSYVLMTAATSRLICADVPAGPVYGQAVLLCANIDLSDTIRSKYNLDVVRHYALPDVFGSQLDSR
jgi:nitrilase